MKKKSLIYYRPEFRQAITDRLVEMYGSNHSIVEHFSWLTRAEEKLMDRIYSTCCIDRRGEKDFGIRVYNVDPIPEWKQYAESCLELESLLAKEAEKLCNQNRQIDVFWSGGIDSTATLLLLNEFAKKDQIHVIMSPGSIDEYTALYRKLIKTLPHSINYEKNIRADISKENISVFANEADTLYSCGAINDVSDDSWDFYEKIRFGWCWRRYRNYEGYIHDRVILSNCESLFKGWDVQKWFIGMHLRGELKRESIRNPKNYLKGKMELRDIIARLTGDKKYAYKKQKVVSLQHGQADFNNGHKNVVAICLDGEIILRENLDKVDPMEFCLELDKD